MQQRYRLVDLLSDGRFHSGGELGRILGVSRSAVWKLARSLEALGVEVFAVRGKGYRLSHPLELLRPEPILAELAPDALALPGRLEILPEVDSTNRYLSNHAPENPEGAQVCFAEYQSAGKGRRGRHWVSPFGANIYLSVSRRFGVLSEGPQGLSLVVGVAIVSALADLGINGVGLKWPNDLLWEGKKLGGILLELSGEPGGPWRVIAGLGLNVNLPPEVARTIDQPWVDLRTVAGRNPGRNRVAGRILAHLLPALETFAAEGFAPFRPRWEALDAARNRPVVIKEPDREIHGIARGVDEAGALLLSVDGRIRKILAGDLSLRMA
uniref:Bifunctional ligase/repressor BirA n=1 Tax=Candidatus Kentrum sp. DK TaxID=2126562 RepID=A0A450SU41_9GAMM|nr:MAG: BirA family transcriptional regulator, biotin operon repressor / biotin-[acetyl-CoA-carboxylase] ligase [Candidatus Kentron sp. DK]VFJ57418.1 MAG: BirA family transcriptional regulator, biotin operon repressor / biotin-[acetyl-CoA-carboxylase] ligase [Candidatus Kentron sp. DK]